IVDSSRVWVMADVFENEMSMIREGMGATSTSSYAGGRKIAARVNYIQPQVDPMTRTSKVRSEAENPGLSSKPDMFVDVDFSVSSPRRVSVPADAVSDAGLRKTVFVDRGDGYSEPRAVETGDRIGNRIEISKGLAAGEKVREADAVTGDRGGGARSWAGGEAMIDRIIEFSAANKFSVFISVGFAVSGGIYSMRTVPSDAIPDLSDTQVIVYSRWDRSPDI
ncbi:hypothetical protein OY671_009050, partial [Metschnikowia pulcherrima]